jgi:hypothetical protein
MAGWLYEGKELTDIAGYYGFVYLITHLSTQKKYVGMKLLTKAKTLPRTKTRRKKKIRVASDWETYYGSNAELLEDVERYGKDQFTREIIRLCKTRGETRYYEAYEILTRDALLRPDYYNRWVSLKLHRSTLEHLQSQSSDSLAGIPTS